MKFYFLSNFRGLEPNFISYNTQIRYLYWTGHAYVLGLFFLYVVIIIERL